MPDITAVTFDLWQTLLLDNRELGRARAQVRLEGTQEALGRAGEDYDLETIREAYRTCYRHCHQVRERNLDISFREQVEVFIENIDAGLVARCPRKPSKRSFVSTPTPSSSIRRSPILTPLPC